MPALKVGDMFPVNVQLVEGNPNNKVDLAPIFKGKKVVMFGVPGAFTPTCTSSHLPSFLNEYDRIKSKGVSEIVCVSVNDAFVMEAWAKTSNAVGKIRFLADADATLAKATGLDFDAAPLGGKRFKRFSALIDDGKVVQLNVEPDNVGATCTLSTGLKL